MAMALGAIALSGVTGSLVDGPFLAILQSAIDPGMQGRVISVFLSLVTLAVPFGMIFGGFFGDRFGAPSLFVVAGIVSLAAAGFSFSSKEILDMEKNAPNVKADGIP
jgi:predicted MFS family arabinose efflux permease